MQHCSDYHIELTEETGYRKGTRFQAKCKACFNQYCMDRWRQVKVKAVEYMGGKCVHCGYDKYEGALEFHHIDPSEKEADWNKLRLKSWNSIKIELDKCIMLCSNCHREEHENIRLNHASMVKGIS